MTRKPSLEEQLKQAKVEKIWLNYFNDSLLEKGIITLEEHRRMETQIITHKRSRVR